MAWADYSIADLIEPPFRRFSIVSPRPRQLVVAALNRAVTPRRLLRFGRVNEPFQGQVWSDGFVITPMVAGHNPFVPVLSGRFEPAPSGARLVVTMRPYWIAVALWFIWMIGAENAAVSALIRTVHAHGSGASDIFMCLLVLAVGYFLASIAFGIEASKARTRLTKIVTAAA